MVTTIDYASFPHIIEAIAAATPPNLSGRWRGTCRALRDFVDERNAAHSAVFSRSSSPEMDIGGLYTPGGLRLPGSFERLVPHIRTFDIRCDHTYIVPFNMSLDSVETVRYVGAKVCSIPPRHSAPHTVIVVVNNHTSGSLFLSIFPTVDEDSYSVKRLVLNLQTHNVDPFVTYMQGRPERLQVVVHFSGQVLREASHKSALVTSIAHIVEETPGAHHTIVGLPSTVEPSEIRQKIRQRHRSFSEAADAMEFLSISEYQEQTDPKVFHLETVFV